jgi:hypothetical protein
MKKLLLSLIFATLLPAAVDAQTFVRLWPGVKKGNIDALSETVVTPEIRGAGSVSVQVGGTYVGTLTVTCTGDGTNYITLDDLFPLNDSSTPVSVISSTGMWTTSITGCTIVKVTSTAWTSGEANVTITSIQSGTAMGSMSIAGITLSSGRIPVLADCNNCGAITGINSSVVEGPVAHDAVMSSTIQPITDGGYASATAPTDVSASGDAVRAWHLLNGSKVVALQSAGTLISGDASGLEVQGGVAHDGVDAGNPGLTGYRAIAHGTNPTAVAAADRTVGYANRAGIPFSIGGHPNVVTVEAQIEDADGAQTNAAIVTVGSGVKVVVTQVSAACDGSTTNPTNIVVGFGTASVPARAAGGTAGIILAMDGIPAGGGITRGNGAGIIAIGADNEDVRITTEDPAGGNCSVELSYFTIES